jgi:hypothetical protein
MFIACEPEHRILNTRKRAPSEAFHVSAAGRLSDDGRGHGGFFILSPARLSLSLSFSLSLSVPHGYSVPR